MTISLAAPFVLSAKKYCTDCGGEFPATSEFFYKCNSGLHGRCRPCFRAEIRRRHAIIPKGERSQSVRRRSLKYKYKLTPEQYDALLEAQGGMCGICERPATDFAGHLHVDHDHTCCPFNRTGKTCGQCVRGLLCRKCNKGIGNFEDDPRLLHAAIVYLASNSVTITSDIEL